MTPQCDALTSGKSAPSNREPVQTAATTISFGATSETVNATVYFAWREGEKPRWVLPVNGRLIITYKWEKIAGCTAEADRDWGCYLEMPLAVVHGPDVMTDNGGRKSRFSHRGFIQSLPPWCQSSAAQQIFSCRKQLTAAGLPLQHRGLLKSRSIRQVPVIVQLNNSFLLFVCFSQSRHAGWCVSLDLIHLFILERAQRPGRTTYHIKTDQSDLFGLYRLARLC